MKENFKILVKPSEDWVFFWKGWVGFRYIVFGLNGSQ